MLELPGVTFWDPVAGTHRPTVTSSGSLGILDPLPVTSSRSLENSDPLTVTSSGSPEVHHPLWVTFGERCAQPNPPNATF